MEMNFCRRCGTKLQNTQGHVYKCANGHTIYVNASPAVGVLFINDKKEALLAVRSQEPAKGKLTLPGGFCNLDETFEAALARELHEELGINPEQYTAPCYLLSDNHLYSYGGESINVAVVAFYARLEGRVIPGDDVERIVWLRYEDVPRDQIAFSVIHKSLDLLYERELL